MHTVAIEQRVMAAVPAIVGPVVVAVAGTLPALCPMRVWSGHACPLCGTTRAIGSLATGDLTTSIRYHPLVLLLVLEVVVLGLLYARSRARPPRSLTGWLVGFNIAAFAIVWLVRWRLGLLSFVVS